MKISVVITVLNEVKTIGRVLGSLAEQTRKPDEIIIIDGGSMDGTIGKLRDFCKKTRRVSLSTRRVNDGMRAEACYYVLKGASIAQGRNFGVKKARYPIIAMTDAGCVIHPDWLERLVQPLQTLRVRKAIGVDVVGGFYRMTGKSVFQRCLRCYLGILPEKLDPKNFLPSTRSIAFTKEIWEKIGGFNEELERTGEDTLFNYQAKKLGVKFMTVPGALVSWEVPKTWQKAVKKFYWYARGDAQARYWPHIRKISLIFLRYWLAILLVLLGRLELLVISGMGYFLWAVSINYRYVRRWQGVFILPILQITSDLAVIGGFSVGYCSKINTRALNSKS